MQIIMKTVRLDNPKSLHGHSLYWVRTGSSLRPRSVWSIALLLCALTLGGCIKEDTSDCEQELSDVPILIQGSVGIDVEVESQNKKQRATQGTIMPTLQGGTGTRAAIEGGAATSPALSMSIVRADETVRDGGVYSNYSNAAISGTRAAATGNTPTALVLTPVQYYQTNGRNTRLTGWHPQVGTGVSYSGGVVTFAFDGSQDIMTAPMVQGSSTNATPLNLVFTHRLSQVRIWIYAADAVAQAAWGQVKGVKILAQRTGCTYTPASDASTGNVVFTGAPSDLTIYDNSTGVTPGIGQGSAVQVGDNVMIEPQASATYVLGLEIAADGAGTTPMQVSLRPQVFEPSKAYNIYLKLTVKDIFPTATISDWGTPTDSNVQL